MNPVLVRETLGMETTEKWRTHTPNPVCEYGDVTVLPYQGIYTDRERTANRLNMTIKISK